MNNKEEIRKTLLEKRRLLSSQKQYDKSLQIVNKVKQCEVYKTANKIAFYHAVRKEADPESLSNDTVKQFYLPILSPNKSQGLLFAPVNANTQYQNNKYAIPEPVCNHEELVAAETLDLIIMPLLGFDKHGNRLGMGGGFYDRSLAFKKKQMKSPILIGFAYDFQEVESLETEAWDIGLDFIATESRLLTIT